MFVVSPTVDVTKADSQALDHSGVGIEYVMKVLSRVITSRHSKVLRGGPLALRLFKTLDDKTLTS